MTVKTQELLTEVKDLYKNAGYGYRAIAKYLAETKGIIVSYHTVKTWLKEAGVELTHTAPSLKEGSKYWYKQEYNKLLKNVKDLERENMELKEALERLDNIEVKVESLEKAQERDKKLINALFKKLMREYKLGHIESIEKEIVEVTKNAGLDKVRRLEDEVRREKYVEHTEVVNTDDIKEKILNILAEGEINRYKLGTKFKFHEVYAFDRAFESLRNEGRIKVEGKIVSLT